MMKNEWSDEEAGGAATAPRPVGLREVVKYIESRGNPNAVSPKGAEGTMQVMPKTQSAPGFGVAPARDKTPAELERVGNDYLDAMVKKYGNVPDALAAYNWGPGNFDKYVAGGRKGSMPSETSTYIANANRFLSNPELMKTGSTPTVAAAAAPKARKNEWGDNETVAVPTRAETVKKASEMALEGMSGPERFFAGTSKVGADFGRTFGLGEDDADSKIRDKALMDTSGGFWGNLAGEVGLTFLPATGAYKVATAVPQLASMAGKAGKLARLTAGGAAGGAVSESMLNRDPVTGALVGAAATPAFAGLGHLVSKGVAGVQRLAAGAKGAAGQRLQDLFGDRTNAAVTSLRNTTPLVPGEQPTVVRATTPELPEMAVIDKVGRGAENVAHLFTQADDATRAARDRTLRGAAPYGDDMVDPVTGVVTKSPYKLIRENQTQPLYKQADDELVPISRDLEKVLTDQNVLKYVRKAQQDVRTLRATAEAKGRAGPKSGRTGPYRDIGELSGKELDILLTDLQKAAKSASGTENEFWLKNAHRAIADEFEARSPVRKEAVSKFRELSVPQNQADTMRYLADKLSTSPRSFVTAADDPSKVLKKVGVGDYVPNFEKLFAANNNTAGLDALRSTQKSVERELLTDAFGTKKSIVGDPQNILDKASVNLPNLMMRPISVIRSVSKTLALQSDERVAKIINEAAADPQKLRALLEQIPPPDRIKAFNAIREAGAKTTPFLSGPSTVSMQKNME